MAVNDDVVPESSPYYWSSESSLAIKDFLAKHKPSMVQDDGTKPWLWVQKSPLEDDVDARSAATEEAVEYLKELTEKVENIKNDPSIPTRGNKKKGIKSKKELREELQAEATEKLKEISVRHGYVCGKWLIFAPPDRVDLIWSSLATSLIEGPLAETCARLVKVSTCPKNETPSYQHVLWLYMPDVYDKSNVTEVLKILFRRHGLSIVGVKSDLYTSIGLDSKHPSGVQSTVWRSNSLLPDAEIKKLKDEFYAELNAAKAVDTDKPADSNQPSAPSATTASKQKPKLKKKVAEDDPFASDDDDEAQDAQASKAKKELKPKKAPLPKKKAQQVFESDEDNEDDEEEQRKEELKAKKAVTNTTRARPSKRPKEEDEDEDEEERPKKRAGRK